MYLILTFDVESNLGEKEITHHLPRLLDILSAYPQIKCTFNVAAHSVEIDRESVQRVLDEGHEVATHGYRHDMNWNVKTKEEQEGLIVKAKALLEAKLGTEVVGWATPRGNEHHADIKLLKKHDFLYVRDRSYRDYYQFIPPKISDGFVELPRFGCDESCFMKRSFIHTVVYPILGVSQYGDQPGILRKLFGSPSSHQHCDWNSGQIFQYLRNLLDYKYNIERTYLVTNLHPYWISRNEELERAFIRFLDYVSSHQEINAIRARDFAQGLINGSISLSSQGGGRTSSNTHQDLVVVDKKLPNLALIFNSYGSGYAGDVTLGLGIFTAFILKIVKHTGKYNLVCDWNKTSPPYQISLRDRTVKLKLELPPYSTSKFYIGKVKKYGSEFEK